MGSCGLICEFGVRFSAHRLSGLQKLWDLGSYGSVDCIINLASFVESG